MKLFRHVVLGIVLALPLVNAHIRVSQPSDEFDRDDETSSDTENVEINGVTYPVAAAKTADQSPATQSEPVAGPVAFMKAAVQEDDKEQQGPVQPHEKAAQAASVAKQAAKVAGNVAKHSKHVKKHAKKALKHALHALHLARTESEELDSKQKESLKKAEARLKEATEKSEHGEVQKLEDTKKSKLEAELKKSEGVSEKDQMKKEIEGLRKSLKEKKVEDKETEEALDKLETDLDKEGEVDDESKAELERLRQMIETMEVAEGEKGTTVAPPAGVAAPAPAEEKATPIEEKGIDIDTAMPYGDLEPFGREDTAQELTEGSIKESDDMVDQIERAEVAEEKRAVFRALTRLRGAAITSFDGVARSQTGNIDEYNKVHKWRKVHPLHHLADEESDISKWAFPENADFVQVNVTAK